MVQLSYWRAPWRREIKEVQINVAERCLANVFTLPGPECNDIQFWLRKGILTAWNSRVFCAERDPRNYELTKSKLSSLGFKHAPVLARDVANLPLRRFTNSLQLAYLDLCGAITPDIYHWMRRELIPCLQPGSRFAVTLNRNWRANRWMGQCVSMLSNGRFLNDTRTDLSKYYPACTEFADTSMLLLALVRLCFAERSLVLEYAREYYANGPSMLAVRYRVDKRSPSTIPGYVRTAFERLTA